MAAYFSTYIPLAIFMYTYPSAAKSHSISYRSLISGGKYFECILIYSALYIRVFRKKYFRSQGINLAPLRESEIVLLNRSFDSKRDAAGDDASSGYSSLSPTTVSLTMYGSNFRGRQSHTKLAYMTVRPVVTSYFLIKSIVLVDRTWLSIPLESLPSSFTTNFHQVSQSFTNNKVSTVSSPPCLL